MAALISILPEHLANKIAAGEVVQRPASAAKELLENAIDAHAARVTLRIEEGGSTLIQCTDDGSGMDPEDALMAFRRHATSKIHTYEDLENIGTLGFRGEALASIGAVARVELRTRRRESEVGTLVRVEGGALKDSSQCATPAGTSILVRNLFYNTPARRNFLKTVTTEFRHVADVAQRIALSHPSIAVKFTSEKETIFDVAASTQDERVKELFGEKLYATLLPVSHETEMLRIHGYVGKPDFARKSRIEQYLYLNGRSVVNRNINHAVFQAYEHLLEKGSFPFFILFLTLDPQRVDVNVHPAKQEVKFADEGMIYRTVVSSLRRALSAHNLVPSLGVRDDRTGQGEIGLSFAAGGPYGQGGDVRELFMPRGTDIPVGQPGTPRGTDIPVGQLGDGGDRQLWQLHHKYIIAPVEGGVMVVDQHAAHERILYEKTIAGFTNHHTQSQQLLFPISVELTPADAALVGQLRGQLEEIGFTLKFFGASTVIVDGVPVDVRPGEEGRILQNVVDLYKRDEADLQLEPRERLAKSYSCRAAIKKGDPLTVPEMRGLLDGLMKTEIPYVCPHGRPVIVTLSLSELDRRFGRTS
jgi:DNA mismatch repair protein MutL